jgi:hypothetical protein
VRALVALVACAFAAAGCGGDEADVVDELVFRTVDGRVVEMPQEVHVWCGSWDPGGIGGSRAVRVYAGRVENGERRRPLWTLDASIEGTPVGTPIRLPRGVDAPRPRGVRLYAAWLPGHENASGFDRADGELTIEALSCEPGARLAFSVDATLGSEFSDGELLTVVGRFEATVGAPAPLPLDG